MGIIFYIQKNMVIKQRDRIVHLGTYLHREYGDHILLSLSAEMQAIIKDTTWDEEKQRPISLLDKELDAVLDAGDKLYFIDISLITETALTAKSPLVSDTFTPQLDSTSVS